MFHVYHVFQTSKPDRVFSPRTMESKMPKIKSAMERRNEDTVKLEWESGKKMIVSKTGRHRFDESVIE